MWTLTKNMMKKKKKGEVIHVLFCSKKSGLYLMCTQENSETPREASSCSSLGSTRKTLHFLQVPLWFWEFDIRSAAVQDISQEKQSSKVYLGKKKSDYRRKAVQNLNGFTWSIWTWLQTEWVAWWISLSSSGFQVHRCEYIKTENRFGNSDHNWKSEIPLLQKWNVWQTWTKHRIPTFPGEQKLSTIQCWKCGNVHWENNKIRIKAQVERHILINLYFLTGRCCVKNFYPC